MPSTIEYVEIVRHYIKICLDFILPQSYFARIAESLSFETLVKKAAPRYIDEKQEVLALFNFKDEAIRKGIWAFKYHNQTSLARTFAKVLYEHLLDELSDSLLFGGFEEPLLMPIPLSRKRLDERGYNQSLLVAKALGSLDSSRSFVLCADVLIRMKETESQVRMRDRKSREENIKHAFKVMDEQKINDRNIILLDDIVTTGATVSEAKKTLLAAGARNVYCIALAH